MNRTKENEVTNTLLIILCHYKDPHSFTFGVIESNSRSPYIDILAQAHKKKTADQQDRVKIFEAWDY